MGMAGSGAAGSNAQGADPPHSFPDARRSATALERVAGASGGHGGVLARDGLAGVERHRVCSGRRWIWRDELAWVHPDQAKARKAIPVPLNAEAVALVQQAGREAPDARVQLSGQADHPGQHQGLVCGAWSVPASRIFAGTICGTPGRAGTCRTARRCSRCRSWAAGSRAEMVRRYAHLAADHLAPYAERLGALRAIDAEIVGTFKSQPEN